jgi:hypothetical protein
MWLIDGLLFIIIIYFSFDDIWMVGVMMRVCTGLVFCYLFPNFLPIGFINAFHCSFLPRITKSDMDCMIHPDLTVTFHDQK